MNQAVNYRNAELDIFQLAHNIYSDPTQIPVSDDPIYNALYNNRYRRTRKSSKEYSAANLGAYYQLNNLGIAFTKASDGDDTVLRTDRLDRLFDSVEQLDYRKTNFTYYPASELAKNEDGTYQTQDVDGVEQYVLKPNAKASQYEISNAKDALAMVDSLYTEKQSTMQKLEVLAYLGVGDYQLGTGYGENAEGEAAHNLFWATHKIIYLSGNSGDDIWFHATSTNGKSVNDNYTYSVMPNMVYEKKPDGNYQIKSQYSAGGCDNAKTIVLESDSTETTWVTTHNKSNYDSSAYGEYKLGAGAVQRNEITINANAATANHIYYDVMTGRNYINGTWSVLNGSSASVEAKSLGQSSNVYVYKVAKNTTTNTHVTKYHYDSSCNRLIFVRYSGSTYYMFNQNGLYMGQMTISDSSNAALYKLITQTTINGETFTVNANRYNGQMTLPAFYITWENGQYTFDVFASKQIYNGMSRNDINNALTSRVQCNGRSTFQHQHTTFDINQVSVSCKHQSATQTPSKEFTYYQVCQGHVDLDVAIVVTTMQDKDDAIFEEAMTILPLEEDTKVGSFLGIVTHSKAEETWGLGSTMHKAYKPYKDWSKSHGLRELARSKTESDHEYEIPEGKDARDLAMEIRHYRNTDQLGQRT